jgi:hypothetical protein
MPLQGLRSATADCLPAAPWPWLGDKAVWWAASRPALAVSRACAPHSNSRVTIRGGLPAVVVQAAAATGPASWLASSTGEIEVRRRSHRSPGLSFMRFPLFGWASAAACPADGHDAAGVMGGYQWSWRA